MTHGWTNYSSNPLPPWEPKEGFCDHSPIGGATEEDLYCSADSGLTQSDTTAIRDAWYDTMQNVFSSVAAAGGWAWQMFNQLSTPGPNVTECNAFFRGEGTRVNETVLLLTFTNSSAEVLPAVSQDLATYLLIRGDYGYLGYAWLGCTSTEVPGFGQSWPYQVPASCTVDYGTPIAPYFETSPGVSGVYQREWTKATVQFDCNAWTGTITMKE